MTDGWVISCKIGLRWMPLDLTNDKSTLVQVMAWCRQATSHYLNQCWPKSLSPYGVTRPQCVKAMELPQSCTKPLIYLLPSCSQEHYLYPSLKQTKDDQPLVCCKKRRPFEPAALTLARKEFTLVGYFHLSWMLCFLNSLDFLPLNIFFFTYKWHVNWCKYIFSVVWWVINAS